MWHNVIILWTTPIRDYIICARPLNDLYIFTNSEPFFLDQLTKKETGYFYWTQEAHCVDVPKITLDQKNNGNRNLFFYDQFEMFQIIIISPLKAERTLNHPKLEKMIKSQVDIW